MLSASEFITKTETGTIELIAFDGLQMLTVTSHCIANLFILSRTKNRIQFTSIILKPLEF